ncbi:MAG TPA: hypothetical protein VMT77_01325 [Gemmatimonadales bacterium]|nr:hypothetical protein [Gemmatimonadales bacterium]
MVARLRRPRRAPRAAALPDYAEWWQDDELLVQHPFAPGQGRLGPAGRM